MNEHSGDQRLAAEQRARVLIDGQLTNADWVVQDKKAMNLFAAQGVAVREVVMKVDHGRADYLLYVDQAVVGVIEAKPQGATLSGVEWQSAMYAEGLPAEVRLKALTVGGRLPFVFEASGSETHFTNGYDPEPRARQIFNIPKPATLARWLRDADGASTSSTDVAATWRGKVQHLPELDPALLRPAQITAIEGIERSLAEQRFDRSLVQMATGAGKTFTAVTSSYRLLKHGGFSRVLFLVDRNNLADQTLAEFQNYRTPDDGRRFTEIYNVDKLSSAGMLGSTSVCISTIQRVFKAIKNEEVSADDDPGLDGFVPEAPVTVSYNPDLPPETFDLVIVDEAHRSIYGVWRGVLEYFDAHVVGLTATPGKQTFGFFRQNLVSEYTYPQSVADRVNVDFDLYRIRTEISEQGSNIEAGTVVPKVDRRTRVQRLEALDEDLAYTQRQLDRAVTARSQIRTVLETFRDRLFTEIFPGRTTVPKTLIFAKDDNHAEEIVTTVREVFGKGNDFAAKITYNARNAKQQLQALRTSPSLRIAVTVDMIATGTDVKPLECVFFMRDVHSAQYFEQMKGRGARTMPAADFQAVTPDAEAKTRFVIVDAVGVTEHEFVDPPLNRQKGVTLKKLLDKAAALSLNEDETATLASRLAKLEVELTPKERTELDGVANGPVRDIIGKLVDAVDPDAQARVREGAADPEAAVQELLDDAVRPLAANPDLRKRILELRATHDRVIDEVSRDLLIDASGVVDTERARSVVESWKAYLEEHRSEITAIQILTEARERRIDFTDIQDLADRISRPPYNWTPDFIWNAYIALEPRSPVDEDGMTVEQEPVRPSRIQPRRTLTDLVSLLRYTVGADSELIPYADRIQERYVAWLTQQEQSGVTFGKTERWWLDRMVEVIASSAGISAGDLDEAPFIERRRGRRAPGPWPPSWHADRRAELGTHRVSWPKTPLRDLGTWYGGGTPSKANPAFWNAGTIPWLSPKDMGPEVLPSTQDNISTAAVSGSSVRLVAANSVAVVVRSGILDRKLPVAVVPFETTLNQDMKALVPHDGIDVRWIAWGLRAFERELLRNTRKAGTTVASIEMSRFMGFELPIPPLDEQRRIIRILENHLSRLDAADSTINSGGRRLVALRRSALDQTFARGRARVPLSQMVSSISAGKSFGAASSPAGPDEWGIIKVSAMTWGEFRPEENKAVSAARADPRYEIHCGDLLVSRANTSEYVGSSVLVGAVRPQLLLSDKSMRIVPKSGVRSDWLWRVLQAPASRAQITAAATGTKDSMRNISQESLLSVEVPLVDEREQTAAVQGFDAISHGMVRLDEEIKSATQRNASLRRTLLAAVFSGRATHHRSSTDRIEEMALT